MTEFRFVVVLSLIGAAGCYSDTQQQSTLPEPHYVAGPPGGVIDPASGYSPNTGEPTGEPVDDAADDDDATASGATAAAGDALAPPPPAQGAVDPLADGDTDAAAERGEDAPAEAGDALAGGSGDAPAEAAGKAVAGAPAAPGDASAVDATAQVTDAEIDATLDGYGQWIDTDDYGQVWRPDATAVGVNFTPYESSGSWAYTDAGWAFSSDYPWGWLPFHYGRWAWFHDYWGWVPGHRWGPAWVHWRHGGGVVGWRPITPRPRPGGYSVRDHRHGSGAVVREHRHAERHAAPWRFATVTDLGRPHIRSHLYGNAAEGLRVTSKVTAPPVRARTAIRATDLMRNRFAGGRFAPPGSSRFGSPQRRDHAVRGDLPPVRTYQPPVRTYQPPVRGTPPVRTYQPPVRTYQPPVSTYQPPVGTYPPPVRTYQPPVGTYPPPARTYQPPVRNSPPARAYQPPARTYQPPVRNSPPARTYSPPARTSPPPSSSHSSSAPSRSSGSRSSGSSSSSGSHSSGSSSRSSSSSSSHSSSSGGGRHR